MLSATALAAAYVLDVVAGDPPAMPHPVRAIGRAIAAGEAALRPSELSPGRALAGGTALALAVTGGTAGAAATALGLLGMVHPGLAVGAGIAAAWTTLATRTLADDASAVLDALDRHDLVTARRRLGHLVGRDTATLDETGVCRAVIETVAESTCDGIVSPLCFLAAGGPVAALAFKAVSTLDSMIGHREPPYTYFGRAAARCDDVANYGPARLTALLLIGTAGRTGGDARRAWRIWRRDARRHDSPNAGQPEAAMAGALGVRLGGPRAYDGVPAAMPWLGTDLASPDRRHARQAIRAMWSVSVAAAAAAVAIRGAVDALCFSHVR